jgi:hypothetical protein
MADTLLKAQLVPIDPKTKQALMDQKIPVHFNPETLKLAYTINNKADTASKNSSEQAAQQVSNSTAKLAVDLVFDTTDLFEAHQDEADVRKKVTNKIVELFVAPPTADAGSNSQPIPANPCLFLWGTFQFVGVVDSYNETLEFFSASGVPLRAAVSLSLSENRYKVTVDRQERLPGKMQSLPVGGQLGLALSNAGMDPTDWRNTALANGMETPRSSGSGSIDVGIGASLGASASAAGGAGFSVGASADLGTGIAGAFTSSGNTGGGFSAGGSFG